MGHAARRWWQRQFSWPRVAAMAAQPVWLVARRGAIALGSWSAKVDP